MVGVVRTTVPWVIRGSGLVAMLGVAAAADGDVVGDLHVDALSGVQPDGAGPGDQLRPDELLLRWDHDEPARRGAVGVGHLIGHDLPDGGGR